MSEFARIGPTSGELHRVLVERLSRTPRGRRKLGLFLKASLEILPDLALGTILERVVVIATELAEVQVGALVVAGRDGSADRVVRHGAEGSPRGSGVTVLGEESALEVPITVRDEAYGVLRLGTAAERAHLDADDGTLASVLAVVAGTAIGQAQLLDETRRRGAWAEASARISAALLEPRPGTDPLDLVAAAALRLTDADVVSHVVDTGHGTFRVQLVRGSGAQDLVGLEYDARSTVAELALRTGRGVRVGSVEEQPRFRLHLDRVIEVGAVLGLPLHGSLGTHGVLVVARRAGRPTFDVSDLELGESFAAQAAVALELGAARLDQQQLAVLEDRERIARDLHDHVVQRLFGAGLTLESVAAAAGPDVADRVDEVVDDLQVTISELRAAIFELQPHAPEGGLRSVVLTAAGEAGSILGRTASVRFDGPVDTVADPDLVRDVSAVVREALSNVARHARATTVEVRVTALGSRLQVVVADDGQGPGDPARRSGVANLTRRAERRGGGCVMLPRVLGGTELVWWVALA